MVPWFDCIQVNCNQSMREDGTGAGFIPDMADLFLLTLRHDLPELLQTRLYARLLVLA